MNLHDTSYKSDTVALAHFYRCQICHIIPSGLWKCPSHCHQHLINTCTWFLQMYSSANVMKKSTKSANLNSAKFWADQCLLTYSLPTFSDHLRHNRTQHCIVTKAVLATAMSKINWIHVRACMYRIRSIRCRGYYLFHHSIYVASLWERWLIESSVYSYQWTGALSPEHSHIFNVQESDPLADIKEDDSSKMN